MSRIEMERMLTEKLQIALVSNFSKNRDDLETAMHEEENMKKATNALESQFRTLEAMREQLVAGLVEISTKTADLVKLEASQEAGKAVRSSAGSRGRKNKDWL